MYALMAGLLACGCVSLVDAPLWPPAGDYVNVAVDCSRSGNVARCMRTRASWASDFNDATAGKYLAQTVVADCLSTGCDGAIKIDPLLGCAWGKVAIETAHIDGVDAESASFRSACGRPYLDDAGERAAEAEARTLRQMLSVK